MTAQIAPARMPKCSHCGSGGADNHWTPQLCADQRKKRSRWLCDPCDAMLNRLVLEFFNDRQVDEKMAAYTQGEELWGMQGREAIP